MAKNIRLIAGLIITAVCFIYIFWNFNWPEFFKALRQADYYYIFSALLVYLITFFLRSYRWRRLVSEGRKIHIKTFISLNFIGYMFNIIFPARAGDLFRAYWISVRANFSKGMGIASIVSERIFDILTIFIILEYLIFTYKGSSNNGLPLWVVQTGKMLGALLLAAFICLIITLFFNKKIVSFVVKIPRLSNKFKEKINFFSSSFFEGLRLIFKKNSFFFALTYTILIWILEGSSAFLVFKSIGIDLSFYVAIFAVIIANIAGLVPASPGQLGIYEAAMVLALSLFGIPKEPALSSALIIHIVTYIVIFLFGLIFLWQEGWNKFGKIPEAFSQEKQN